jgi:acetate kinase
VKVLTINSGSSSIKFQVFDTDSTCAIAKGIVAKIGGKGSYLEQEVDDNKFKQEIPVPSHRIGFNIIIETLVSRKYGILRDISEISAVGHRAVHGGDTFTTSVLITEDTIEKMSELIPLAPLHNPSNLIGIKEAKRLLPDIPHVAVFDTAFHQTLPPKAYIYPLPYTYYTKHKIRKYGFHGTSCQSVSRKAARILGKPLEELRMIICHLGNGVTVTAVNGGKSVDTSMGLTPLEGLMMGTRSGDVDPGVIFFLHRQLGLTIDRIDGLLNKESGLLGISGVSNDMREIEEKASSGNEQCQLAMEMFVYRVKKYIGAYAAALGGITTLVFTAGIGENSPVIRAMICDGLKFLGIDLDKDKNTRAIGVESIVSTSASQVCIAVIPTDEEEIIASETLTIAGLLIKSKQSTFHVS